MFERVRGCTQVIRNQCDLVNVTYLYTSEEKRDITCVSLSAREVEGGSASREGLSSAILGRAERSVKRMKMRRMLGEVAEHMHT